jgi:hypothetical protein
LGLGLRLEPRRGKGRCNSTGRFFEVSSLRRLRRFRIEFSRCAAGELALVAVPIGRHGLDAIGCEGLA